MADDKISEVVLLIKEDGSQPSDDMPPEDWFNAMLRYKIYTALTAPYEAKA